MPRSTGSLHDAHDESRTVLLIIDMMSTWHFPDAAKLRHAALAITPTVALLKNRCKAAGVPVIYANDNQGRWRSDWRQLMSLVEGEGGDGAKIAGQLAPDEDDYFVLKPMHSAFFGTPLSLLLKHLKARELILAGVSSDQCVMATAEAARMRQYGITVPHDVVASQTAQRTRASIDHFENVMKLRTTSATRLRLRQQRAMS